MHFGRCGGCSLLTTPIAEQLRRKADRVQGLLARHLGAVQVEYEVPLLTPRRDRTRILYPIQPDRRRRLTMGIYARGSHDVVEIQECMIQERALTLLGKRVLAILRDQALEPYDEATGKGFVRAFSARIAPGTGELLLGLVTTAGAVPQPEALISQLRAAAHGLRDQQGRVLAPVGIVRNRNDAPGNALLGRESETLWGRDHLLDRAAGLTFRISFASFAQSHRDAEAVLYAPAFALLGPLDGLRIVDGYGGGGAFGLRAARYGARSVVIRESSPSACRDAAANIAANALPQVQVSEGPFATYEPAGATDLLIVDPPRAGLMADGAAAALRIGAPQLLHVACSAEALARDLDRLGAGGYRVGRCRLADLFPHTEHVEVLTLLQKQV